MAKCIHYWLCETGENGKVPARCLKCNKRTVFEPKLLDGHSALDFDSSWLDLRVRAYGGAKRLSPRRSGAWRGDWDNVVRIVEG